MPWEKATSVPWRHLPCLSTSYGVNGDAGRCGVNKLSGAEAVLAQLFYQSSTPNAQQTRRAGNRAVRFLERFADQSDFNGRHMILQIDTAARERGIYIQHFVNHPARIGLRYLRFLQCDALRAWLRACVAQHLAR